MQKENQTERQRRADELFDRSRTVAHGKDARALHRELIEFFGKGSGMPISYRYPNLPIVCSMITSALSLVAAIIALVFSKGQ